MDQTMCDISDSVASPSGLFFSVNRMNVGTQSGLQPQEWPMGWTLHGSNRVMVGFFCLCHLSEQQGGVNAILLFPVWADLLSRPRLKPYCFH